MRINRIALLKDCTHQTLRNIEGIYKNAEII